MAQQQPDLTIIEFTSGRELTVQEARSGAYVFAAGPDPRTFAFREEDDAQRRIEEWADWQGLRELLEQAREAVVKSAGDSGSDCDAEADRAQVAEDTRRLAQLARELGKPRGAPEVLEVAHQRGILNTAYLYPSPGFHPRWDGVPIERSTPDLSPYLPYGAQSCWSIGQWSVALYRQVKYGPNPFVPLHQYYYPRTDWDRTAAPIFSIALG